MLFPELLNAKQGNSMCHFLQVFGMTRPGIEPRPTAHKTSILSRDQRINDPYCLHAWKAISGMIEKFSEFWKISRVKMTETQDSIIWKQVCVILLCCMMTSCFTVIFLLSNRVSSVFTMKWMIWFWTCHMLTKPCITSWTSVHEQGLSLCL